VKTIVLASTKGGAGKSTIAQALAVEASKEGKAFLADFDPQQSIARWWERRGRPGNPMLVDETLSAPRALDLLKKRNTEVDWLFIDTPGSNLEIIRGALKLADVVLVIAQPSSKDIEAQGALEDLIDRAGQQERALYVVNRGTKADKLTKDAVEFLAEKSALPPVLLCNRIDHARADVAGRTAAESNKDAAKEIAALWAAVKRIAG
jgi:chromosome partitioning protein